MKRMEKRILFLKRLCKRVLKHFKNRAIYTSSILVSQLMEHIKKAWKYFLLKAGGK
jgi:hypothetical protein